ncbi:MAG: glycosyltransferase family 4 protein [Pseudonocardiaceae bacterium]
MSTTLPTVHQVLHVIVSQREGAIGGADLHVLDLAAAQQQNGTYRPLILAPRASRDYLQRLNEADLEVLSPNLFRLDRYRRLLRQRGITLLHAHGYEANYLTAAMRALCRRWRWLPLVVTAHGWIETTPRLRLHSHLDRYCARLAHVRIATAARHAPRFHAGRGIVVVIPNGVPDRGCPHALMDARTLMRASLGVPPKATIIGSVGRLSPEKRVDLVLAAAYRLVPDCPDLHVLVVGGGEQRAKLQVLAQRLGLSGRVTFTGLLQDVTPALIAMDVLLQPSDTEGTPRSVLEAMAHRLPVVATDVGDLAKLLDQGRCGELIPPGDADLLARAVGRLLADPTRAQNLVQCARLRYEDHYSIEVMRRRVEQAYHTAYRADAQERRL